MDSPGGLVAMCGGRGGGGQLMQQPGSPPHEPRVSSFRKWIARRLRVLHTHIDIRGLHPPSRQANSLAEGKRTRESSFFSPRDPPLRPPIELAEWVIFPEKYAHFDPLEAPIGGGGRRSNGMQQNPAIGVPTPDQPVSARSLMQMASASGHGWHN
jgi:hypothetical protein